MPREDTWSEEELKASVATYAKMYKADREGRKVNKKQMYRDLEEQFGRRDKAFERRMMNISHVVTLLGGNYVRGLVPAPHIGENTQPILERLVKEAGFLELDTTIQAPTTLPLELDKLDEEADGLQKEWRKSGKKVLPPNGFVRAEEYKSETLQRKRCAGVKAWVLESAKGVCESCGIDAPFFKSSGDPYLEVHHVIQLADDGPDKTSNAVALCPNCHRALHLADNKDQLVEDLYRRVSRLER